MLKNIRLASQAVFLFLFLGLFIQTEGKGVDYIAYPVKLFLDADPLISITTCLTNRSWSYLPVIAIAVILATVILGRVFCGWICPLGTLHNMAGYFSRQKATRMPASWYKIKYLVLLFILTASVFSLQLSGWLDPLAFLIRSLSIAVYPALSFGVQAFLDTAPALQGIEPFLKKIFLPFQQPFYLESLLIGFLFLAVIALNLWERRFWCKCLCPLGALLGLLSRYSLLKRSVSEGCNECGACASSCQGNAVPEIKGASRNTECVVCMNCDDLCPKNAVRFTFSRKQASAGMDIGKRRILGSVIAGIAAVPLVRISPVRNAAYASPELIRPPGALKEDDFLKRCVKCGECMKVCITNGLQPTLLEAGIEGIWTPVLIPRLGYCEYRCTLCGQVCPTGAIRKLPPDEKMKVKIGLATIDKNRCLPYAHETPCIVCEEVCPLPKKAISLTQVEVIDRQGQRISLKQPRVDMKLCIGCGMCEAKCPIMGNPAIKVGSEGESRLPEKQLLLP